MPSVLYLLLAVFQITQAPAVTTEKPADKKECQVFGQIVQQEGGEPLKNAHAVLKPETGSKDTKISVLKTGVDGRFCFSDVAPGRYRLGAERVGYVPQMYGSDDSWSQGMVLALEKGQKLESMLIRLVRASVISGKILDEDGEPAVGILVQALVPPDTLEPLLVGETEGTRLLHSNTLLPVQTTSTNDLGEYRLAGLPPGQYLVDAVDSRNRMSDMSLVGNYISEGTEAEDSEKYAPTYYPGTTRREQAVSIDVKSGNDSIANIQLMHEKMITVSGTVVHEDGTPVIGAMVSLTDSNLAPFMFSGLGDMVDAKGHFSIQHVLPGAYTLRATAFQGDDMKQGLQARQKIEAGQQDVSNLRLVVGRGLSLTGKITVEGGSFSKIGQCNLVLQQKDDIFSDYTGAAIDNEGNIKADGLAPSTYKVSLSGLPEPYYVKRVIYAGRQSPDQMITFESGVESGKLELVVSPNAAAVNGSVENADHSPLGGVVVFLREGPGNEKNVPAIGYATSDQNGKFSFHGLAPGAYTIGVKKRANSNSPANSAEVDVKIAESERKSITIKIESSGAK
jgi:protocatechuate 3,4-dioxygenase beta subunit